MFMNLYFSSISKIFWTLKNVHELKKCLGFQKKSWQFQENVHYSWKDVQFFQKYSSILKNVCGYKKFKNIMKYWPLLQILWTFKKKDPVF